jgi:hypothetical protein
MAVAPIGAGGAMAFTVGSFGIKTLIPLGRLMLDVYATMAIFIFVVLGTICRIYGFRLLEFLRYIKDEILLVLGTNRTTILLSIPGALIAVAYPFFKRFFVWNWCPLAFVSASGANITPDKLPAGERAPLESACDAALRGAIEILEPRCVVGFGGFATRCIERSLGDASSSFVVGTVLHPSPASPAANRGWEPAVERSLETLGIELRTAAILRR